MCKRGLSGAQPGVPAPVENPGAAQTWQGTPGSKTQQQAPEPAETEEHAPGLAPFTLAGQPEPRRDCAQRGPGSLCSPLQSGEGDSLLQLIQFRLVFTPAQLPDC